MQESKTFNLPNLKNSPKPVRGRFQTFLMSGDKSHLPPDISTWSSGRLKSLMTKLMSVYWSKVGTSMLKITMRNAFSAVILSMDKNSTLTELKMNY